MIVPTGRISGGLFFSSPRTDSSDQQDIHSNPRDYTKTT